MIILFKILVYLTSAAFLVKGTFLDDERSQCERISAEVAMEDQNSIVDTSVKRLMGTWLSESCEIRPGPEYALRSYTFKTDGTYRVIQHHYWDESCSSPKLTITSTGMIRLKKGSLLNPDAATGFIRPINITVIPQDNNSAKELDDLVVKECPGQNWKSWRPYEEHVVFESNEYLSHTATEYNFRSNQNVFQTNAQNTLNTQRNLAQSSGDISCLGPLRWAFNELKLLKIQMRPVQERILGKLEKKFMRVELALGDIHSRLEQREHYVPTSFQTPLLKYFKDETVLKINHQNYTVRNVCNICAGLYSGDKSPPHLIVKAHLPPYIWGEWISVRCETRPMGLYLTRKFSFYSEDSIWIGEHKFFQDPFCTIPKFVVTAAGHFALTSASTLIEGATNIDFKIERASLTLFNRRMLHEMRASKSCGSQNWESGVPQELSSTNGCLQLGVIIPSIQYELVKVEMNYQGACLIYFGQSDTDNMPRMTNARPTAFQEPLVKCGDVGKYSETLTEILDGESKEYDYDYAFNVGSIVRFQYFYVFLLAIVCIYL